MKMIKKFSKLDVDDLKKICVFMRELSNEFIDRGGLKLHRGLYFKLKKEALNNKFPRIKYANRLKRSIFGRINTIYSKIEKLLQFELDAYSMLLEKDPNSFETMPKEYLPDLINIKERMRVKKVVGDL